MSGYLDFERTGNLEVDAIISMIEQAGDSYHHTAQWVDAGDKGLSIVEEINILIGVAAIKLSKQPNA